MKQSILLLTFLLSFFLFTEQVYAQLTTKSNTVTTRVGNPINVGDANGVLEWDTKIVDSLQPGLWGYLNQLTTALTNGSYSTGTWPGANTGNLYWCTYSIVDSYNLAGFSGLSKASHGAVVTMRNFWKQASGYKYVDYTDGSQNLSQVNPGYAIFMEKAAGQFLGSEHVAMVKTISLDSRGNGFIETQDSNSSAKIHKYTVDNWSIKNTSYPVRGFGGI